MPRIHILPDRLISQIAAGEVVERPASVVKELVENALDAGARELRIELEAGGKRRIVVTDDGSGMGRDDSLLAFDRHATSKIATFDDLENVATLGFRGEALSSIAGVAKVELLTAEAPGEGWRVRIEGGRVLHAEPAATPRGTRLEIASLFFNVPARRAFLKSPETELRRCVEVVQGYALARPEVRFRVLHDGRELLEAPAAAEVAGGLRERVAQIFGAELERQLVEIGPAGAAEIGGLVGNRATARGRRQFVFVNRRLIRDRAVMATYYRAVREEWASEDFPALFLFLTVPAAEVDVNVHPQKAEVRFRDPGLLDRLHAALRGGLARARGEEPAPWRILDPGERPAGALAWSGHGGRDAWTGDTEVREPGRLAEAVYAPLERTPVPGPLAGRGAGPSRFRLLGQYKGTLLLLEGPDGLYLIDQHVAHERILYERLRRSLESSERPSQVLLVPHLLALGPSERLRLLELREELAGFGFSLEELSGGTVALRATPAVVSADEAEALLLRLASESAGGAADLRRRLLDALAASQACQAAIKMHHPLGPEAMEALVGELFAAEQPFACPHGRPIVLQMTDADLERRFGRRR